MESADDSRLVIMGLRESAATLPDDVLPRLLMEAAKALASLTAIAVLRHPEKQDDINQKVGRDLTGFFDEALEMLLSPRENQ